MSHILVIEDNRDLAEGLKSNLEIEGYSVAICPSGGDALDRIRQEKPDLVVLDMMLPECDGFEILAGLRRQGTDVAVLCLTARGEEIDKVRALRSGADDYVTKPFGLMELMARVEALLRRRQGNEDNRIRFGSVVVDLRARTVSRNDAPVTLAPKEFDLLAALASRPNEVLTRQELMAEAWGHSSAIVSRTVDTHIAELRRKLERDPADPQHILTARKAGYRLVL